MAIQSLKDFQKTFACEPVEVDIEISGSDPISVYLKPLTSAQRDNFEASVVGIDGKRNLKNLRARLVSDSLVNEKGERIGDPKSIGELNAKLVTAIFEKVMKLNGMEAEDSLDEAGKD